MMNLDAILNKIENANPNELLEEILNYPTSEDSPKIADWIGFKETLQEKEKTND